jgi:hypothetical protein
MANFVKCRFAFIGNKAIEDLVKEIKKRIIDDMEIHDSYSDTSRVGRIFYGLEGQDAVLGHEAIRSKWIHDDQDYDGIGFVGGWDPVRGFQDHLLKYACQLDPKLIVLMEYEDESPNFVGARYVLMKDGIISEYESELDLSDTLVTVDSDYEDALAENEESNEYEEIILWEDLYYKINDCKKIAFSNMKQDNSWIPEDYLKRNPDDHS